jgi:hypothetical protein
VTAGDYRFSVGTAGSTGLVLQTVLTPLLLADGPSRLVLEGGTHNMLAPPLSCPLLSGPSTMTVWTKEGTRNACHEAQARGDHWEVA